VIKSDGEASFPTAITKVFGPEIVHIVDTSPNTYHNKTVDAVIRTLRNALGENNQVLISNPTFAVQFICRSLTDIYQNGTLTPLGEQIKHSFNLSITPI